MVAETFDEILKTNRSFEALEDIETSTDLNADDPEASVVKFVNQIIREAIHERATDIHVEPLENDLRIRYRIDGILHEVAVPPQLRLLQSAIISRLKVMAHMDIAESISTRTAIVCNRRPDESAFVTIQP
jgi:type II secretory ATPase GspE/PulE/Tfp pilus assembly ATPase PilB-like protein